MRGSMSSLTAILTACALEPPLPIVERVSPPEGLVDRPNTIAILGRFLEPNAMEHGADVRTMSWRITLGGQPLFDVEWVSEGRLDAVVPPGLPSGPLDLVLSEPGREVRLASAWLAVSPVVPRLDRAEPPVVPESGGEFLLRGAGLHRGTVVRLGEHEADATWMNDQTLRVGTPPLPHGPVRVEVQTPVGSASREDLIVVGE